MLHPLVGPLLLTVVLFLMFQAVFAWAEAPMGWIESATAALADAVTAALCPGPLRSLLVDGVIAGAGGVLVFLPQIMILFFFILVLEESGYLPRAAFLLDRLMGSVGLSGRSFIPLLSSFACAIPGIMATRTISRPARPAGDDPDRAADDLLGPAAGLHLLIRRFVPARRLAGGVELQGLVLFALYVAGIAGAMAVAWVLKRFTRAGRQVRPLMMELPAYHWPALRNVSPSGCGSACSIFMRRVGGIILTLTIALWFLASYPGAAGGRHRGRRSNTAWPAAWGTAWPRCSSRSGSTGRSASRWCRAWRRARWLSARWARSTRCRPPATTRPRR